MRRSIAMLRARHQLFLSGFLTLVAATAIAGTAFAQDDPECTQAKFRQAGKYAACMAAQIAKAAKAGLDAADAAATASARCRPKLDRRFGRLDDCVGSAADVAVSGASCLINYADEERGIFGPSADQKAGAVFLRLFGKAVACKLKVVGRNPDEPDPRRDLRCELRLRRRIALEFGSIVDEEIALRRADECVSGAIAFLREGALPCTESEGCDDSNVCTSDVCTSAGVCKYTTIFCIDESVCLPESGCIACATDSDCTDDASVCVDAACDEGACMLVDATCPAERPTCVEHRGCIECLSDDDCADADACTLDFCSDAGTCDSTPLLCSPGQACDPATGACEGDPLIPGDCNDDRLIDPDDAACIASCDGAQPTGACEAADCNCDASIDAADEQCRLARSTGAPVLDGECTISPGDVNRDGRVSASDTLALTDCLDDRTAAEDCWVAADCDCDGDVDSDDQDCSLSRATGGGPSPDACTVCPSSAVIVDSSAQQLQGVVGSIITAHEFAIDDVDAYRRFAAPVTVTLGTPGGQGRPVACEIDWEIVGGDSYLFPTAPTSGPSGGASAYWTAGPTVGGDHSIRAVVQRRDGSTTARTFHAVVRAEPAKQGARYVSFDVPQSGAEGYAIDVTIEREIPPATFLAGPVTHNHRVGIQSVGAGGDKQRFQFSIFRDCDCSDEAQCMPVPESFENNSDPGLAVSCRNATDGAPCAIARTCESARRTRDSSEAWWQVGDTLRIELRFVEVDIDGDEIADAMDFTALVANLTADPEGNLREIAVIRRRNPEVPDRMSTFIEQFSPAQAPDCYQNPERFFSISNARYLPRGADPEVGSDWVAITSARMPGRPGGCQNELFDVEGDRFRMSVGGNARVGPPHPSASRAVFSELEP